MIKRFLTVTALSMALILGVTGCSGVADLFKGGKSDDADSEDVLESLVPMDERREELLKDIDDLVVLGDYKGVEVKVPPVEITDEQVQVAINVELANAGTVEQITEGTVEEGDTVNIDYEGKLDGVAFQGGTDQDHNLVIGSGDFIDGFEDALIGAAVGSTVDINVTFPDPYTNNPDLAGKDTVFTVTINYKHGDTIPAELTDEWVASLGITDVTTVDQYREYIREDLEAEAESEDQQKVYDALMDLIVSNSEIKGYSEDLDKDELNQQEIDALQEYADYYETDLETLISQYWGVSLEEYKQGLAEDIDKYCDRIMIYRAVIKAENLKVSQEDYEERVLLYSPSYAEYGEESEAAFVANNSAAIYDGLLNEAAENFLIDNANVIRE